MTTNATSEHFSAPGIDAHLRCDDRSCTFDISVERELVDVDKPKIRLEVLLQPTEPSSGLPYGIPLKLLNEAVDLNCSPPRQRAHGRTWLPGIAPDVAAQCYYRVVIEEN